MSVLPAATPSLTVQYGSFHIDETNKCILVSAYVLEDTSTDGSFYIEFECRMDPSGSGDAADDSTFATAIEALELALQIPRQNLVVKLRGVDVVSARGSNGWTSVNSLMISPELLLKEENCRNYRYGFRVRCQFVGNVPGNAFRRESLTTAHDSQHANREVMIQGSWTRGGGLSALGAYLANAGAFFPSYLPANSTDQYGNGGTWVLADQVTPYNDENSLITVSRTYLEVFAGRRDSMVKQIVAIGDRRVLEIPSEWRASPGFSSLENYTDNNGAFFTDVLTATPNLSGGQWVQVDERFGYNDQDGVLTATRIYHEVINGLRTQEVTVTTDQFGLRTLVLMGVFYSTPDGQTAKQNFTTYISGLVTAAVAAETPTITHYESHSVPKVENYDQNLQRYTFRWTLKELAFPQSGTVASPTWDDANVLFQVLDIDVESPYEAFSKTAANAITILRKGTARFTLGINFQANQDPVAYYFSTIRAHILDAISTKLGAALTIHVTDDRPGVGLDRNQLVGFLSFIVTGGSVLRCKLVQKVIQSPGRDFVPRADGTNYSVRAYHCPPEKVLVRTGYIEYVVGTGPPALFAVGDETTSGFGFMATGKTAQQSIDDQNASGALSLPTDGWFIDRRASEPYSFTDEPMTLGDGSGLQTVIHSQTETWRFVAALESGS